ARWASSRRRHRGRHASLSRCPCRRQGPRRVYTVSGRRRQARRCSDDGQKRARHRSSPGGGASAMTRGEQIRAVAKLGFTERQAGFLVTVLVHAGVCVGRQYCVYARIVRGQKVHDFFSTLVAKKFATPYTSAHRGARLYHLQGKTLYSAVGEPDNRNRRPATLARAIERLMLLDVVLAEGSLKWL